LIAAAIARLPINDATLDGEAACLSTTEDGNFHALRSRHARQDARLIV
jgi:ATP-dependent DNA ligase